MLEVLNVDILIVDDTIENIKLLSEILDVHNISFSRSGEEALNLLQEESYDLILLDIMMPGIDGYETCERLRKLPLHTETPLIFLTAKSDNESILKAFKAGGQDYIVKPFNTLELQARVKNQLLYKQYQNEQQQKLLIEREKNQAKDLSLLQQTKMAQMGESFSMMAHQWKQPLSAIMAISNGLLTQIQLSQVNAKDLQKNLEDITQSVEHLTRTINEYKSFFKPKYSFEKITPDELIHKVLLLNQHTLKLNNIELTIHFSDKHLVFSTLVNEIIQVFLVIIQNSIDAYKQNNKLGKIEISFTNSAKDLYIDISDEAGGVNDSDLSKIFELNFTNKGQDGLGVGLYMSKIIIEEHLKGSIAVSNIDQGSRFSIVLPLNTTDLKHLE